MYYESPPPLQFDLITIMLGLVILRRCIFYVKRTSFFYSSSAYPLSYVLPFSSNSETRAIVTSFRDWFKTSQNPLFDNIFRILNDQAADDLTPSSSRIDVALSQMDFNLSESFVLEVLNYRKNDVLPCLKFFDWASRQPGFYHTRATFIAILKVLSRAKLTSLMLDLLDAYGKQRLWNKVSGDSVLVMGYAMAGRLDLALQLFGKMRFNGLDLNAIAYHVLLNALVERSYFDAMDVVLSQIRMRGYEDHVSHAIVMKSFCKQDKLEEAERYLRTLFAGEQVVTGRTFAILVDALCKQDMFSWAGKLIHEFGEAADVTMHEAYGVWIRHLVQAGKIDQAMKFFRTKKAFEHYTPEIFRYNFLIRRLLLKNRLLEACDILMDMKESQVVPDKVTMNVALCFFCKAGMIDVVLQLYKLRSELGFTPNSLVYNYIINNLCGEGSTDEAYRVLRNCMDQGYFPSKKSFSILADALCREGKLDKIKDLVMLALERKFMPADTTYGKFIRALCRARRVEDGYLIHSELNRLNYHTSEDTYSILIKGFVSMNRGDIAARLLLEMQDKGYKPERRLFTDVIRRLCEGENPEKQFLQLLEMQLTHYGPKVNVFNFFINGAGHSTQPDLAREVYEMMKRIGIVPNLVSDIFMLQAYLKSGRIADALSFFDHINKRRKMGRKLYTSMVVGLCKAGKAEFAFTILRQARNNGLGLGLECYEELIKLYCFEKKYDDAIKLINDMEKVGRKISSFIGNVLLLHSLQSKDLYDAWIRSRKTSDETPSSSMLGELIAAFSSQSRENCRIEDLEEIIQKCFPLDLYSYNMMLRKLSCDQIDVACNLFNQLHLKGYEPNRWTYEILVHGLFKHGRSAEAKAWAEKMIREGHFLTDKTRLLA